MKPPSPLGFFSVIALAGIILMSGQVDPGAARESSNTPVAEASIPPAAPSTPGSTFADCKDGCPAMVVIPEGRFLMGSGRYPREQPRHVVTIPASFAVGKFDVTFDEWAACAGDGGCQSNRSPSDQGWGRGRHPVVNVSWADANQYASWLSRKTGRDYRLLTEAEWEYAARAGSTADFPWGDAINCGRARYDGGPGSACAEGTGGRGGTRPVGRYPPNAWGLYDMQGNVWQWCQDGWHEDYHGAPVDGSAWRGGDETMAVMRGGAWNYAASGLRSSDRNWLPRSARTDFVGFRVARSLDVDVAALPSAARSD